MKGVIRIFSEDIHNDFKVEIHEDYSYEFDFVYSLYLNDKDVIVDVLNDKESINKYLDDRIVCAKEFEDKKDEMLNYKYQEFVNSIDSIVSYIDEVQIMDNYELFINMINNSNLLDKKIVFFTSVLDEKFLLLLNKYEGDRKNIFIKIPNNKESIHIDDYKNTNSVIDSYVKEILSYNYSPLEKLLHLYDIVRSREYIYPEKNDAYNVSRDLTNVLFGEKIVCEGFANIFDAVAKKLGFNSELHYLLYTKEKNKGHVRNVIYVKDDKYNIEGIYFFDPTFDCKKNNNNDYLKKYKYFARTKSFYNSIEGSNFSDDFSFLTKSIPVEFEEATENINRTSETFLLKKELYKLINKLLRLTNNAQLPNQKLELFELSNLIYDIDYLLNNQIPYNVFYKVLCKVRYNQSKLDSEKYKKDAESIVEAIVNSKILIEHPLFKALSPSKKVFSVVTEEHVRKLIKK